MKKAGTLTALTAGLFMGTALAAGNVSAPEQNAPLETTFDYAARSNVLMMKARHTACSADKHLVSKNVTMYIYLDNTATDIMAEDTLQKLSEAYQDTVMPHTQKLYALFLSNMTADQYVFMTRINLDFLTEEQEAEYIQSIRERMSLADRYAKENANAIVTDTARFNSAMEEILAPHFIQLVSDKARREASYSKAPSPACP